MDRATIGDSFVCVWAAAVGGSDQCWRDANALAYSVIVCAWSGWWKGKHAMHREDKRGKSATNLKLMYGGDGFSRLIVFHTEQWPVSALLLMTGLLAGCARTVAGWVSSSQPRRRNSSPPWAFCGSATIDYLHALSISLSIGSHRSNPRPFCASGRTTVIILAFPARVAGLVAAIQAVHTPR